MTRRLKVAPVSEFSKEIMVFHEIGKAVNSTLELPEVLKIILDRVDELLNPRSWGLLMFDETNKRLRFELVAGVDRALLEDVHLGVGKGITGWVAQHGKPIAVSDVGKDHRYEGWIDWFLGFSARSALSVPVKSREKVLGVITLLNDESRGGFNDKDLFLLSTLADYTAIAVENSRYLHKMRDLSVMDGETGVYNSRFLFRSLEKEIKRAKRYESTLSVVFIDLDYFKYVNDGYGHLAGSNLLQEVGEVLVTHLRDVDIVTRYEADEFVAILPETGKKEAVLTAQRIREAINGHEFRPGKNLSLTITASYGVASYPDDGQTATDLIQAADQAMFRVKESTRDGIALAGG